MAQRCAVIDLGSNTAKLLVADVGPGGIDAVYLESSAPCRLGRRLDGTGIVADQSIDRALAVVGELVALARDEGAAEIAAVATSALRSAKNGADVAAAIERRHGLAVQILTGEEEAGGILQGVLSDSSFRDQSLLVMDLGGGSAEWIQAGPGEPVHKVSAEVGCVRMSERFLPDHPVSPEQRASLEAFLIGALRQPLSSFSAQGRTTVLTGGTACALAALRNPRFLDKSNAGGHLRLSAPEASLLVDELAKRSLREIEAVASMPSGRADIVVAGGVTLLFALKMLGACEFYVSRRNLRYGWLIRMARG